MFINVQLEDISFSYTLGEFIQINTIAVTQQQPFWTRVKNAFKYLVGVQKLKFENGAVVFTKNDKESFNKIIKMFNDFNYKITGCRTESNTISILSALANTITNRCVSQVHFYNKLCDGFLNFVVVLDHPIKSTVEHEKSVIQEGFNFANLSGGIKCKINFVDAQATNIEEIFDKFKQDDGFMFFMYQRHGCPWSEQG